MQEKAIEDSVPVSMTKRNAVIVRQLNELDPLFESLVKEAKKLLYEATNGTVWWKPKSAKLY